MLMKTGAQPLTEQLAARFTQSMFDGVSNKHMGLRRALSTKLAGIAAARPVRLLVARLWET